LAVLGWSSEASAQNVNVVQAQITRTLVSRDQASGPYDISYADCLSKDEFQFPVTVANLLGRNLEVWLGNTSADCTQSLQRQQINPVVCRRIFGPATVAQTGLQVSIGDRAIVDGLGITNCEDAAQLGNNVSLFFMLVGDPAENLDPSNVWKWTGTIVDLVGPLPPTGVSVGVGDAALLVDFTKSDATDIIGYRIYWDDGTGPAPTTPQPGQGSIVNGGAGGGTSTTTTTDTTTTTTLGGSWPPPPPPASDGGTGGAGGAGGAKGAGGTGTGGTTGAGGKTAAGGADAGTKDGGTSSDAGAGGSSATSTATDDAGVSAGPGCPVSKAVVQGRVPDPGYANFSQQAGPSTITGLTNGTAYAVGVVAYDKVGNVGQMSNVACGTPQPISDFFAIYRAEGGRAGGGCEVAPSRDGALAFTLAGAALLGLGLVVRRAPRPRARTSSRAKTPRGSR
jgi:hypothetical protein